MDKQGFNPFVDSDDALNPFLPSSLPEISRRLISSSTQSSAINYIDQSNSKNEKQFISSSTATSSYSPCNPHKNNMQQATQHISNAMQTWDSIASRLLSEKFLLTALELHSELVETGRELPRLSSFFSNPANFDLTAATSVSLPSNNSFANISRSCSQTTLDSLDWAYGGSEEGGGASGGAGDERLHLLEFELRRARETIQALRNTLTQATATATPASNTATAPSCSGVSTSSTSAFHWHGVGSIQENGQLQPHQKATINFLVGEYLAIQGYKMAAITFAEEDDNQEFENWDDVGLNMPRPPSLAKLVCEPHAAPVMSTSSVENTTSNVPNETDESTPFKLKLTDVGTKSNETKLLTPASTSGVCSSDEAASHEQTSAGDENENHKNSTSGVDVQPDEIASARNVNEINLLNEQLEELKIKCEQQERELYRLHHFTSTPFTSPQKHSSTENLVCSNPNGPQTTDMETKAEVITDLFAAQTYREVNDDAVVSIEDMVENSGVQLEQDMLQPSLRDADIFNRKNAFGNSKDIPIQQPRMLPVKLGSADVSLCKENKSNRKTCIRFEAVISGGSMSDGGNNSTTVLDATAEELLKYHTKIVVTALRQHNQNLSGIHCWASITACCLCRCCLLQSDTSNTQPCLSVIQQQLWLQTLHGGSTATAAADVLPLLVSTLRNVLPNVLLAKRDELVPLLMLCLQHSPSEEQRSELLSLLLLLSKKPDTRQRATVVTALLFLLVTSKTNMEEYFRDIKEKCTENDDEKELHQNKEEVQLQNKTEPKIDDTTEALHNECETNTCETENGVDVIQGLSGEEVLPFCRRLLEGKNTEQRLLGVQCVALLALEAATASVSRGGRFAQPDLLVDMILMSLEGEKSFPVRDCMMASLAFFLCLPISKNRLDAILNAFVSSLEEDYWPGIREINLGKTSITVGNERQNIAGEAPEAELNQSGVLLLHKALAQRCFDDDNVEYFLTKLHSRINELISIGCDSATDKSKQPVATALLSSNDAKLKVASLITAIDKSMPYLLSSLMCSAPSGESFTLNEEELSSEMRWMLNKIKQITDAEDEMSLQKRLCSLRANLSRDWTNSWRLYDYVTKIFLPSLVSSLVHFEATETSVVQSYILLFYNVSLSIGVAATDTHLLPLFHKLLSMDESDLEDIRSGSTSLTRAPLVVFTVAVLGYQHGQGSSNGSSGAPCSPSSGDASSVDVQSGSGGFDPAATVTPLQDFLSRHISIVCLCGGSLAAVEVAVSTLLAWLPCTQEAVLAVLWACLVSKAPQVRRSSADLWTLAAVHAQPSVLWQRLLPGLVTLSTDEDVAVQAMALRPLVTVASRGGEQVVSKCTVQLESLLEDGQLVQHEVLQLQLAAVTAETAAGGAADQLLHTVLLPRLCSLLNPPSSPDGPTLSSPVLRACVSAYNAVLLRAPPQHVVAHFVVPALERLSSLCSGSSSQHMFADVTSLIKEFKHLMNAPQQQQQQHHLFRPLSGDTSNMTSNSFPSAAPTLPTTTAPLPSSPASLPLAGGVTSPVEDVKHRVSKMFSSGRQVAERANVSFPSLFKKK